jgi:hypothetical protein
MVLLLPAVFAMVARSERGGGMRRFTLAGLLAVNLGCLILNTADVYSFWFFWVSPALLGLYVAHLTSARPVRPPTLTPLSGSP